MLTPAERAALNGENGSGAPAGATVKSGDAKTAAAIDRAAETGATIGSEEEHPPTKVIEVPEGGRVDDSKH